MTDPKSAANEAPPTAPPAVKRPPGHRAADVRDTVAEMAAKAKEISEEAGSRMGAAMKELITAAAGLAGFAVESARDLVQFMVRRGQMTQEEADKLMKEVESAQPKKKATPPPSKTAPAQGASRNVVNESVAPRAAVAKVPATPKPATQSAKPAAKPSSKKAASKPPAKAAAKKAPAKKPAAKAAKKPNTKKK